MHNFFTHGLFIKDDSFKKGAQLHPFHKHDPAATYIEKRELLQK